MEGKRPATTRTELYMLLITLAVLLILGIVDVEMPFIPFLSVALSLFVTALFMISRKRYSWIVAFLYYVFMIPLLLYFHNQIDPLATILLLATYVALALMAFSENERLVHKIFL